MLLGLRSRTAIVAVACLSLLTACSGDDGGTTGPGGFGGQAGSGGAAGSAGSAGSAGAAGTGGSSGEAGSAGTGGSTPSAPEIINPGTQFVDEDTTLSMVISVEPASDPPRVWVDGLPPGARFDEPSRVLTFTPDFIQGGDTWTVTITATNEVGSAAQSFELSIQDTIHPPLPAIRGTEPGSGYTNLDVAQTTDDYLDSAGHAGRTLDERVYIPDGASDANPMLVRVYLHRFGGAPYFFFFFFFFFCIYAHDPMNTYWWGYGNALPNGDPSSGSAPNYTQRRVLHLLEWVLRNHPGADPERVYVVGGSMGGAGAATLGLLYARHFAFAESEIGQMVPRNHRPSRLDQLEGLWGTTDDNLPDGTALEDGTSLGVWDRQDLCRVLRDVPEARDQFVFTKHGKDDPTIHFGAVTHASPVTQQSFYDALQHEAVGHYAVWDEGAHGPVDPVMGDHWWDNDWSLLFDPTSYLRRDRPFPAFSFASQDWDPGDGTGNGLQTWSDESGFAGDVTQPGDTGWTGDIAGARNRFLRWDTNGIVDDRDRLEMPLFVVNGSGQDAPQEGYPSRGDQVDRTLPIFVNVTPRRVRRFACLPGESIAWSFAGQTGTLTANPDGSVTVPQLPLDTTPQTLVLTRASD